MHRLFLYLSLSYSLVFRINTGKGEKKNWVEYERKKKKNRKEHTLHTPMEHGSYKREEERG